MARSLEAAPAISRLAAKTVDANARAARVLHPQSRRPGGDPGLPVSFHVQRVIRVEAHCAPCFEVAEAAMKKDRYDGRACKRASRVLERSPLVAFRFLPVLRAVGANLGGIVMPVFRLPLHEKRL